MIKKWFVGEKYVFGEWLRKGYRFRTGCENSLHGIVMENG